MRKYGAGLLALLVLGLTGAPAAAAGEVVIYTGNVFWISKADADAQAEICADKLLEWGIPCTWYRGEDPAAEKAEIAAWMQAATGNGKQEILVLYGYFPETIYPGGNTQPNGSIAERFIESNDGDAIVNHGDYMFYKSSPDNGVLGLQSMMDITDVTMSADNTPMKVTPLGKAVCSSLDNFWSDRVFFPAQLKGEWFVEAAFGVNHDGTRVEPAIIRDGTRGRLIPIYQTNTQSWDPKGAVAAEIISWLFGVDRGPAAGLGIRASRPKAAVTDDTRAAAWTGDPLEFTVDLLETTGSGTKAAADVTVTLETTSPSGRFDLSPDGPFSGAVTTVKIPAGASYVDVYYKDTAAGTPTLTVSAAGLSPWSCEVKIFARSFAPRGEVAFYTAATSWTSLQVANAQAQITADKLRDIGVNSTIFSAIAQEDALANWVMDKTGNGKLDVLVTYGYVPPSIYQPGNAQPEGSIAELFIESTDGDVILNHADAFWYVSRGTNNGYDGLRNLTDLVGFRQDEVTTAFTVTAEGAEIAPSLINFSGTRPFYVDMLYKDWLVEAVLAQNATGARADPVILRDGDRGRVIPVFQASNEFLPKGAVAADIITWLYGISVADPVKMGIVGPTITGVREPLRFVAQIQNLIGSPMGAPADTTVTLATSSATGRFDVLPDGPFDGTLTTLSIPAGESSAVFFFKDTAAGTYTVSASAAGLVMAKVNVNVRPWTFAPAGEVAIYTGATFWLPKTEADQDAQICADRLAEVGIAVTIFNATSDEGALANWVTSRTADGKLDVLIINGRLPDSLYSPPNRQPDGSPAELFIESTDGNAILNHGDWLFYKSTLEFEADGTTSRNNGSAALQNIMDIPGIGMSADDTPVFVTAEGRDIAPCLRNFQPDRVFFPAQLGGEWYVEVALARNADGTRVSPAIVRDGNRGRLIAGFMTNRIDAQVPPEPKGALSAEIAAWLMGWRLTPLQLRLANTGGAAATLQSMPMALTVEICDAAGVPAPATADVTARLTSNSGSGAFDFARKGAFSAPAVSVTIPAGATSATVFYKDGRVGSPVLSATDTGSPALVSASLAVDVLAAAPVEPGTVAIYTGNTGWISKAEADAQAEICVDALDAAGIEAQWFASPAQKADVANWVTAATNNGKVDVLVLYGYVPETIFGAGNTQPDNSLAELFIESTDGDMILNHADWMFYVSIVNNGAEGLQHLMDTNPITLWGDNTPMYVTPDGAEIAPTLEDYKTDRALRFNELKGEWHIEAALARDAYAPRADPVIARDGNRGRVAFAYQTNPADPTYVPDPKGAVAAEMIAWIMTQIPEIEPVTDIYVWMGNVNGDGAVNIADAVALLQYLFAGGKPPVCAKAADANDDDAVNIADAVKILGFLFSGQAMTAPDGSGITAANNVCKGYAADGVDGKNVPYFPAQVSGLPPCATQCKL